MKHSRIESRITTIPQSQNPTKTVISSYPCDGTYDVGYFMIQIQDLTNDEYQFSEFVVVDDYQPEILNYNTYDTEFGIIETGSTIGTIESRIVKSNSRFYCRNTSFIHASTRNRCKSSFIHECIKE